MSPLLIVSELRFCRVYLSSSKRGILNNSPPRHYLAKRDFKVTRFVTFLLNRACHARYTYTVRVSQTHPRYGICRTPLALGIGYIYKLLEFVVSRFYLMFRRCAGHSQGCKCKHSCTTTHINDTLIPFRCQRKYRCLSPPFSIILCGFL